MVDDARTNTRTFLDTYLTSANILEDDGTTEAMWIVCFGKPDYPIIEVFMQKDVDLIFSIGEPNSKPLLKHDQTPRGYLEHVPITTFCINKPGITGTKLKWQAEAELRRICETYPTGSQRALERRGDNDKLLGSTMLYSTEFWLDYKRDTT